jgi:hypothetical protein
MPTKTSVPGSPGPSCRRSANPTPLKKLSHPDKLVRGYRVGLGGLRDVVATMGSAGAPGPPVPVLWATIVANVNNCLHTPLDPRARGRSGSLRE